METVDLGIRRILQDMKNGSISASEAERSLAGLIAESNRQAPGQNNSPVVEKSEFDVVCATGKSCAQVVEEFSLMLKRNSQALAIRCDLDTISDLKKTFSEACADEMAKVVWAKPDITLRPGSQVVVVADSSAYAVAQEALITLEFAGYMPERLYDVSVADISKLLKKISRFANADVVIVAAGHDVALASVIAGLVSCPVLSVPVCGETSGQLLEISMLFGMLNSCAPGVSVVGINNGYGAAVSAVKILQIANQPV